MLEKSTDSLFVRTGTLCRGILGNKEFIATLEKMLKDGYEADFMSGQVVISDEYCCHPLLELNRSYPQNCRIFFRKHRPLLHYIMFEKERVKSKALVEAWHHEGDESRVIQIDDQCDLIKRDIKLSYLPEAGWDMPELQGFRKGIKEAKDKFLEKPYAILLSKEQYKEFNLKTKYEDFKYDPRFSGEIVAPKYKEARGSEENNFEDKKVELLNEWLDKAYQELGKILEQEVEDRVALYQADLEQAKANWSKIPIMGKVTIAPRLLI